MASDDNALLNLDEAAQRLRIGNSTLRALIARGQIASVKVGKRRLLTPEAIAAFIAKLTAEATIALSGKA